MKLQEIFGRGHFVAVASSPVRYVARCPFPPAGDGYWPVSAATLDGVAHRKRVEAEDLEGTLSADDLRSEHWKVDDSHCWCEECSASRKMLETQSDF
ncbi:MAG: hypothetical protein D6731_07730 [Planctomycetota bacterium]|nr:MAG: hypothetical protein D6731_07730 [Planctomycetota bacterium]